MKIILHLVIFLLGFSLSAQQKSTVRLLNADNASGSQLNGEMVRYFVGHVKIENEGVYLSADKMVKFEVRNFWDITGNVKLQDKEVTLTSKFATYTPDKSLSTFRGDVHLLSDSTDLYSDFGNYNLQSQTADFWGKTKLLDSDKTVIESDSLTHFKPQGHSILKNNIKITNKQDHSIITGGYAEYFTETKYSFVRQNPFLYQLPEKMNDDTLFIHGKLMESWQGEIQRYAVYGHVRVLKGSLSARSDTLILLRNQNLMKLRNNPIVWFESTQISGDSIDIYLQNNELKRIHCYGSAIAISSLDSMPNKYNQIKGKSIYYYFENKLISKIEIKQTAESVYYMDEDGEPTGANLSSGDEMFIYFTEGQLDRIKIIGGIEGKFLPESLVRKDPVFLRGFYWAEKQRPLDWEMRQYVR